MLPLAVFPWAPELEKLITESPTLRLAAYLTWNASAGPPGAKITVDALHIPVGGGGGIFAIVMVQPPAGVVAVSPIESVTMAVNVSGPAVVGVPEMAPVDVFSVRGEMLPLVIEYV